MLDSSRVHVWSCPTLATRHGDIFFFLLLLMTPDWQCQLFRTCSQWWAARRSSSRWREVWGSRPPGTRRPHCLPPLDVGRWASWWRREEQLLRRLSPPPLPLPSHCRKTTPPYCHCHSSRESELTICCCCCCSPFILDHLHLSCHFVFALNFLWNCRLRFKNFISTGLCWQSLDAQWEDRTINKSNFQSKERSTLYVIIQFSESR